MDADGTGRDNATKSSLLKPCHPASAPQGELTPRVPSLFLTDLQRGKIKSGTVQRFVSIFLLIFPLKISLWTRFAHAEWIEIKGNYGFCFALNGPCNPEICSWNLWLTLQYCLSHLSSAIFHCFQMPFLVFSFNFSLKALFLMCFKCWAPGIRSKISQGFEEGNAKRSPSKIPCPPKILLIWKNKGKQQREEELGAHSWDLGVTPPQWMKSWQAVIFVCLVRLRRGKVPKESISLT